MLAAAPGGLLPRVFGMEEETHAFPGTGYTQEVGGQQREHRGFQAVAALSWVAEGPVSCCLPTSWVGYQGALWACP